MGFHNIDKKSSLFPSLDDIRVQLLRDIHNKYGSISKFVDSMCERKFHERSIHRLGTKEDLSMRMLEQVAQCLGYKITAVLEKK